MNKRKLISSALALSLTFGAAHLSFADTAVQGTSTVQAEFQVNADVSGQISQLSSFDSIKGLFGEKTDLSKVKANYEQNFKTSVTARNPAIDNEISMMLEAGILGTASNGQVKQAIDKGLQWFFYEEINAYVGEARTALSTGDKEKANVALDKAAKLFEGTIYVTAGKRDKDFGTGMQEFLKTAFAGLNQAVDNGDFTTFNVYRQYFQKTMMKVFVLATAKYGTVVEKDVSEGKADAALTHMAEGYFFFMPISNYLSGGNAEAAAAIRSALSSGDPSLVNGEAIKTHLATAISAKVNEYAGKTFNVDLAAGDKAGALIHAAEGNAFSSQLEVIIKERLGAEAYTALQSHGQLYYESLEADKTEEARMHAFEVLKLISKVKGVHFEIAGNELNVDGNKLTYNEPTSFLNNETNRTLASTRFIAEALGSKVDWIASEKKIIITKGEKTVELVTGSSEVIVNGTKDDKLQLDQPVVIRDGRSYIPVRAVAEVIGGKVFYFDGEVIIN
jgi:hypothetical protein